MLKYKRKYAILKIEKGVNIVRNNDGKVKKVVIK